MPRPCGLYPALAICALMLPSLGRTQDSGSKVETCSKSFGTLAVAEPQAGWGHLSQYGLGSPAALLRMMIQQSGCFDVVERGVAMQNLAQERALAQSGNLRQDSNLGAGQMQAADFVMTPTVQIGAQTTGGLGGGLLGRIGGGTLGAILGGLKFKEASTSLLVADVRSSIQVAAAEGKASNTDFSIGGWSVGPGAAGSAGGYTSTPEGKVVAASFLDNYNKVVASIRDKPNLIRANSAAGDANATVSTRAEAPQPAGQMLTPKIANVKVYAEPSRDSAVVATLRLGEELVATGEAKNGFARVDAANFSGWVQRTLVGPLAAAPTSQALPAAAPIVTTAAPMALPTPKYRYGAFAGSVDGADKGNFRIIIDDEGGVSGNGSLARIGAFGLMGAYNPSKGTLAMQGGSSAGSVLFMGRFDPSSGAIVGTWSTGGVAGMYSGGQGGGSFSARRE